MDFSISDPGETGTGTAKFWTMIHIFFKCLEVFVRFVSRCLVAFIHLFRRFLTADVMTNKSRHHITPQETPRLYVYLPYRNNVPAQHTAVFIYLILTWISSGVSRHGTPYLALLPPSRSFTSFRPPLTDKTQNFDSSLWAGARKFLAGSLCPRQGITQWSYSLKSPISQVKLFQSFLPSALPSLVHVFTITSFFLFF